MAPTPNWVDVTVAVSGGAPVAHPNSTLDSAPGIQSAINDAQLNLLPVYIPGGVYQIGTAVTIGTIGTTQLSSELKIFGDGQAETVLMAGTAFSNGTILLYNGPTITGSETLTTFIDIADIRFTAQSSASNVTAIYLAGSGYSSTADLIGNISIEDIAIVSCETGIVVKNAYNVVLSNIDIQSAGTANVLYTGVSIYVCGDVSLTNVNVNNGGGTSTASGAFVIQGATVDNPSGEGCSLVNCTVNDFQGVALHLIDHHFGSVVGCDFSACHFGGVIANASTSGDGCSGWSFSSSNIQSYGLVSGGTIYGYNYPAITLDSSSTFFQFNGCLINDGQYGIVAGGSRHVINGNVFTNNATNDISVDGVSYSVVTSNVCDSSEATYNISDAGGGIGNLVGQNMVRNYIYVTGTGSTTPNNITNYNTIT